MKRRDLRRQLIDSILAVDLPRVAEIATLDTTILNAPTAHQNVPLADAIATGRLDLVKLLIESRCRAAPLQSWRPQPAGWGGVFRSSGDRPLSYLTRHGAYRASRSSHWQHLPLGTNANCRFRTSGAYRCRRPMENDAAALAANVEAVEYLLSIDAPVEAENHNGHTALALMVESLLREFRLPMATRLL